MTILNRQAYAMEKDQLIYDVKHPIDAVAVQVSITADESGVISRGQLLDYAEDGKYNIHAEGGEASAIVAEGTSYASDDTEITVTAYISGTFRANQVIANPEITDADMEVLREKGIYLK